MRAYGGIGPDPEGPDMPFDGGGGTLADWPP